MDQLQVLLEFLVAQVAHQAHQLLAEFLQPDRVEALPELAHQLAQALMFQMLLAAQDQCQPDNKLTY